MNKVRDIIRYGHTTDLSERQIARALGVSRTVVTKILQAFRASGLEFDVVELMPDSELQKSLIFDSLPPFESAYPSNLQGF